MKRGSILQRAFFKTYSWLTERLYNEFAWAYDPVSWAISFGQWDTVRKWALEYEIGPRVLEVGFGTGELLQAMAGRGLQVTGLDQSAAMHRIVRRKLRRKLRRAGVQLACVRGPTQHMPFAGGSFDTIVSTFPAGYIFDPDTWVEAARCLCPGGRFVVIGFGSAPAKDPISIAARVFERMPMEQILGRLIQLGQDAGLALEVDRRAELGPVIPVLIASKK